MNDIHDQVMPRPIRTMVAFLGALFAFFVIAGLFLMFTGSFSIVLLVLMAISSFIAFDFLHSAFTRRWPFLALRWVIPH